MSKSVMKSEENMPATRPSFMQGSGRGSENVGVDDLTIPRLDLIQAISPQRRKTDPEYIEGAEEGMLFNTVSKQLYGTSVTFVPVFFRKEWIIWKIRKAGGGFVGAFRTEVEAVHAMRDLELDPEIHEITDTGQHFGLIVDNISGDFKAEEIVISMSKSKMKVSRQLNTMVRMAGGDRFERAYLMGSIEAQNTAGDDYYNLSLKPMGFVSKGLYELAEKVYESVSMGAKDVSRNDS